MTTSRHLAAPLRPRRHWTTDRVISAGLAVTACAGIVGVIGVRSIEDSAAAQQAPAVDSGVSSTPVVSSTGLTEAQLDEYAAQLQAEAARLDAYRVKLSHAAEAVTATSQPAARTSPRPAAAKPVAKPAPKAVAKPAPKPESTTKSS